MDKNNRPKHYKIESLETYEIDEITIKKGEIRFQCFGRPIPKGWKKAQ